MSYFIGIDVGTSATKSVLFDETGKNIFSNSSEYELIQPHNGWAQQRPNDWKNTAVETLKSIVQKVNVEEIKGIGVTGQMHGLVVLDENNDVLYDSIIWCDQRTEKEVNQIMECYVGIVRSNLRLTRAWNRLDILYEETESLFKRCKASREICELRNMINVGYLITRQAMERKESRGLHYTIDYPHKKE